MSKLSLTTEELEKIIAERTRQDKTEIKRLTEALVESEQQARNWKLNYEEVRKSRDSYSEADSANRIAAETKYAVLYEVYRKNMAELLECQVKLEILNTQPHD